MNAIGAAVERLRSASLAVDSTSESYGREACERHEVTVLDGPGRDARPGPFRQHMIVAAISRFVLAGSLIVSGGCTGLHFDDAEPASTEVRYALSDLPQREQWSGIVFTGEKIGFAHMQIEPVTGEPHYFDIRSEAALRFRLLTVDKRVTLRSVDRIDEGLRLQQFDYDHNLDGNRLVQHGRVESGSLIVELGTGDQRVTERHSLDGPLYPTSVINLYPVLYGLAIGRVYEYRVYDGETRSISGVRQEVLGYESSGLFEGEAFKLRTELHGQTVTTWLDLQARPLLEISMNGVLIAALESEDRARRYLAQGTLGKSEILIDFSLIRPDRGIEAPRGVVSMTVGITGLPPGLIPPSDEVQRCARERGSWVCTVEMADGGGPPAVVSEGTRSRYLEPSFVAPSRSPLIRARADEAARDGLSDYELARAIVDWIQTHVEREAVDAFTALDVLERGRAECQGHSYLYAAMARARGLPTRLVNGIVYSDQFEGFLYHTWTESVLDGRWTAVDPTFGQIPADATHLKLVEGEGLAELAPMLEAVGRIQVEVRDVSHRSRSPVPRSGRWPAYRTSLRSAGAE